MFITGNIPNNDVEGFLCLLVYFMINIFYFLRKLTVLHVFNSDVDIIFGSSVLADLLRALSHHSNTGRS